MLENAVARRYAQAFFVIAKGENMLEKLAGELQSVVEAIEGNEGLKKVFDHKLVPPEEKKALVDQLFAADLSPVTLNFVNIVIEKRRENYLSEIYEQFIAYVNQDKNIIVAEVKSAAALSQEDLAALREKLAAATGKDLRLEAVLDESIVGGIVVRIGDKVIDGSITARLGSLKDQLMQINLKEIGVRN